MRAVLLDLKASGCSLSAWQPLRHRLSRLSGRRVPRMADTPAAPHPPLSRRGELRGANGTGG